MGLRKTVRQYLNLIHVEFSPGYVFNPVEVAIFDFLMVSLLACLLYFCAVMLPRLVGYGHNRWEYYLYGTAPLASNVYQGF